MGERNSSKSIPKAICSVSYLAQSLGMSRSRFYQLVDRGVFPHPIYDLRTKRPFYDLRLQEVCRNVKASGIAYDGSYVMFYSPRRNKPAPESKPTQPRNGKSDTKFKEIQESLEMMGLEISCKQISEAIPAVFPEGIENQDPGLILRELFRHFKNKV